MKSANTAPKVRRIALCGLLTALCILISYLELAITPPGLGLPGVKLGLANICVLWALYRLGLGYAAAVNFVRVLLAWAFFGNFISFIYSLAGAILSLAVEELLIKSSKFSEIGVSAAGGAAHNFGQLFAAVIILGKGAVSYFPLLLLAGTAAGTLNGIILKIIIKRTDKSRKGSS